MIKILQQLLETDCFHEEAAQTDKASTTLSDAKRDIVVKTMNAESIDLEIQILKNEFGNPLPAQININLSNLLKLLPRVRRKADAYKGLRTRLMKQFGVELIITNSSRHKNKKNNERN